MTPGRVSIVVASYRRPAQLERCLRALAEQTVPPDEVVVAWRRGDEPTRRVALAAGAVDVAVDVPGVLAAMTAGARAASGGLIGFVDDDVRPRPTWLEQCLSHLADPRVGGVSGRDVVVGDEHHPPEPDPGRIGRWGRMRGDHHLGAGPPRAVDVLKAANLLFRREALWLPGGLRGEGAQPHFEVAMCLAAASRGWTLVFDPSIQVDHEPARRWDRDQRGAPSPEAVSDGAYNLVRSICAFRPELLTRRAAYGLLVGDRGAPGLGRALAAALRGDRATARKLAPSLRGQWAALVDSRREGGLPLFAPGEA